MTPLPEPAWEAEFDKKFLTEVDLEVGIGKFVKRKLLLTQVNENGDTIKSFIRTLLTSATEAGKREAVEEKEKEIREWAENRKCLNCGMSVKKCYCYRKHSLTRKEI